MEFGCFHLMPWRQAGSDLAWPFSEDAFDPEIGPAVYETYLSQLAYCEELGFDSVGLNEHHYSAYGLMPSPNLMAGNLANRTDDIEIALMGNVLPIRGNPIRLAEELAMLDNVTDGRVLSGFVRGIPSEYTAYNVHPDESRARMAEAWDLIVRAWTEPEPFDFDGEFWQYENVYIWPRPVQDPHPPLWMPAESQRSLEFAVEKRVPTSNVYVDTQTIAEGWAYYRRHAREAYGWEPDESYFWNTRMTYVAETEAAAREEAEAALEYFYDTLLGGVYRAGIQNQMMEGVDGYREDDSFDYAEHAPEKATKAMNFDFEALCETGEIIVGTPASVTEEIERQYEAMGGFGRFVGLFQFGNLGDEAVRRNLELFADEVMPELRSLAA